MNNSQDDVLRIAEAVVIETDRFIIRSLTETDVSDRYLQWLSNNDANRFITSAASTTTLESLRKYVCNYSTRLNTIFLGIFDRPTLLHIGNIKYDPIDQAAGYTIMGLLIGDQNFRGRGVAGEVLIASAAWLRKNRSIKQIVLGVHRDNVAAIRAYEKVGFQIANTPHIPNPASNALTMVWDLNG